MHLRIYLFNKNLKVHEFCKIIGCSRIHLSEILNGRRAPSHILATAIENATNGEVTVAEIMAIKPRDSTSE